MDRVPAGGGIMPRMTVIMREARPDDAEALLSHVRTLLAEPGLSVFTTLEEFT